MISRGLKLVDVDCFTTESVEFFLYLFDRKFYILFIDIGADDEIAVLFKGMKRSVDTIRQSFFFADIFHESRSEITTEDMTDEKNISIIPIRTEDGFFSHANGCL